MPVNTDYSSEGQCGILMSALIGGVGSLLMSKIFARNGDVERFSGLGVGEWVRRLANGRIFVSGSQNFEVDGVVLRALE
jgi:hypothetical protein